MLSADSIFRNGHIITLDPAKPLAQALAVRKGKIVAVGTNDEVSELAGHDTHLINLDGYTVVPGFHDAHCHILLFGLSLTELNVREAETIREILERVRQRAQETYGDRGREWIRGGGYNENKLRENRHPTGAELDAVAPGRPVFLSHVSGHMAVASSRALEIAGIAAGTPDPEGGIIERDEHGVPTGLLKETAQELVKRVLPPYSLDQVKAALAAAGQQMASEGITSAQDAWSGWVAPQEFRAYQETSADGSLPQHVRLMPDAESLSTRNGYFDLAFGLHTGFGSNRLKLGAMKFFLDGSLVGRTAALSAPYSNAPDTCGFLVKSEETIRAQIDMAHRGGWQIAMHAIGDRAIEVGLAAIEAVIGSDASLFRPRIEHCGVLRLDLIERIRRLGVVVVTQPRFIAELGDGFRPALGEERLRLTYPMASLRGLQVAFSSDRPVVNGAPLLGIQAAAMQRTLSGAPYVPGEAITVGEGLLSYTLGAAYSAFEERQKGSLAPGRLADFAVLSGDILHIPPEELDRVRVLMTCVAGQVEFQS